MSCKLYLMCKLIFAIDYLTGMCVLAGCDFLSSVPGIGIVKSHGLVSKYRNLDRVSSLYLLIKNVIRFN